MSVRAKFKVMSIERLSGNGYFGNPKEVQNIKLSPVYDNNKDSENGKFYAATPSGKIELITVNPEAGNQFELDKQYYIDFTKAE